MSNTGKQSPLGVNVLGTLLQNKGFYINPKIRDLAGISRYNSNYEPGEIVNNTCLRWLTYAVNSAYNKINTDAPVITSGNWYVTQRYKIVSIGATIGAGDMVAGTLYEIVSKGTTNFTDYGALSNDVGTKFFATGAGFGSGSVITNPTDFTEIGASTNEVGVTFVVTGPGIVNVTELVTTPISLKYIIEDLGTANWDAICPDPDERSWGLGTPSVGDVFLAMVPSDPNWTGTAFQLTAGSGDGTAVRYDVDTDTYEKLLNVGQSRIPALGNSPPPTYLIEDPSNQWDGQVTTGYGIAGDGSTYVNDETLSVSYPYFGQGQEAKWWPFDFTNPNISASQWGWLRLLPLQAWNEFNYNGSSPGQEVPEYRYFLQSFLTAQGFVDYSNKAIFAIQDSKDFLKGIYSNMDDLTSSDITGVSLANRAFGQDLLNLGKAMDLSYISTFGLPSNLLKTLKKNNALTTKLSTALLGANLSATDISNITSGTPASFEQEQALYGAFSIILGNDLKEILVTLNCTTKGLRSLADLLDIKKIFPISYQSLTVPIYNTEPNPTNSKTYYLLFVNGQLNPQLIKPEIIEKVDPIIPPLPEPPPVVVPEPIVEPPITIIDIIEVPPPPVVLPPIEVAPVPQPPPPPPYVPPPAPVEVQPPPLPFVTGRDAAGRGGGGGCVALESYIPLVETEQKHNGREITKAWMLESGMKISLGTEELSIIDGQVGKTLNDYQPCVRISTSDGITLVCSTTAPILTKDKGFIPATEVYGKRVAVMRNGRTWYDEVVGLEDVGMKFVRVIDAGDNSFWAGERPGSFILHHNVPINDKYNYDKK
jgi:hypothetical protein